MKFSTASIVVGAFAFGSEVILARPNPVPKIPSVKNSRLFQRPAVQDYVVPSSSTTRFASYLADNSTSLNSTAAPAVSNSSVPVSNTTASPTVASPKTNIWLTLSNDEAADVVKFLHGMDSLNLTAAADATTWDNMISAIDLAPPNKTAALNYLSGNGSEPGRYARASIMFSTTDEPYLEDFLVGPLPLSNKTTAIPYDFATTKGTSKIRNYDADADKVYDYTFELAATADDIITDLCGANSSTFDIFGIDPLWMENGRVVYWVGLWGIPTTVFDGETLLPQGVYFKLDVTGRDKEGWKLIGWLYGGIYYTSTEEFRAAWKKPDFVKYTINAGVDQPWIGSDQTGDALKYDEQAPPVQIQPDGQRFAVDDSQKYVEWMDFSFYITFTRDTGMRLFDIKYKGERIIYELGLNEAIAHYAGNDPVQSGTGYLDTFYGFGPYAFELLPGFDCPTYAHFMNATFHADEVSTTHRNGICLFESDAMYAMQRHSSMNYVSATKNIFLTLRSVSTVGNYDYTFDYAFYLDGSIETIVRASGYIQSAFYGVNEEYGYHIHDGLSGSMHDHSLNWKLDMDILGTKNTLEAHTLVPVTVDYPWSNFSRSTMKMERSVIASECESKLNWPHNAQTMYIVSNTDEKNKFGENRGYRVMPSKGGMGMHLTIQNSSNLFNSQGFATHQLYVTQHHDSEPYSAHYSNAYDPRNPVIDFSKFFNNESLVQEDLVLWFNLGMHHVPHTGDLPNTVMTTAQSGIIISPHNYLLSDPSRATKQMVRLNYNSSDQYIVSDVVTFGAEAPTGLFDVSQTVFNYTAYKGDTNVRKLPYDPQHPYNETESIV